MTLADLLAIFPAAKPLHLERYVEPLQKLPVSFCVDTPQRQAMFLAQVAVESALFSRVVENLHYTTAERLRQVFSVFRRTRPEPYLRNPEKLANLVYAHRNGNGTVESGDGWRYRGRGLLQITGRSNYAMLMDVMAYHILDDPDYLLTPDGAVLSAAAFWQTRQCYVPADQGKVDACTRLINGPAMLHAAQRRNYYTTALAVLRV